MTGHGSASAPLAAGRVAVDVRAVNHRHLDTRVRMPPELCAHTAVLEQRVRDSLERGHVEVHVRLTGDLFGAAQLDVQRATDAFVQLRALRDDLSPAEPVPLSLLAAVPGLFQPDAPADDAQIAAVLTGLLEDACEQLWQMRRTEGEALAVELELHLDRLMSELTFITERVDGVVAGYREKLLKRIARLLKDTDIILDPGRLEHEVALFADRADVTEEVARLMIHAEQLRTLLHGDDTRLGKRLDFLLQEMTRETNTIGSKCSDADLAQAVVRMKTAISRMREQAQNVL